MLPTVKSQTLSEHTRHPWKASRRTQPMALYRPPYLRSRICLVTPSSFLCVTSPVHFNLHHDACPGQSIVVLCSAIGSIQGHASHDAAPRCTSQLQRSEPPGYGLLHCLFCPSCYCLSVRLSPHVWKNCYQSQSLPMRR